MSRLWRQAVVATVSVALLSSVAARPAQAAPQGNRVAAVTTAVSTVTEAAPVSGVAGTMSTTTHRAADPTEVTPQVTPAKLIRLLGSRLSAAIAAIRAGWAAFQRWWNGLPTLVRLAFQAVASAWTWYKVLCGYYNLC